MAADPDGRIMLPSVGRSPAAEMDLEIAAHVQLCIDDLVRSGMDPAAARVEAERRSAHLERARPALHQAARQRSAALRHRDWIGALQSDVKFAWRQMRRNATHSALAIAMLAIGIGMSTAMFTLVERVLLHPLPFPHAERLVNVQGRDSLQQAVAVVSNDDWLDWHRDTKSFAAFAAYAIPFRTSLTIRDSAVRVTMTTVSGEYFRVLQSRFIAGRAFTPEEVAAGTAGAVVSEKFWRRYLGADSTLGAAMHAPGSAEPALAKQIFGSNIVGVVADDASFPVDVDVWQPVAIRSWGGGGTRNNIGLFAIARMQPGVTIAAASADLDRVARSIRARDTRGLYDFGASARPLQSLVVEADTASSLRLLMECVAVVLLIVCANLAVVTLGRGAARQQELAIRASLGAARGRIISQLLVEHLLLAVIGGAGGIVVAWAAVRALVYYWGESIPRASEVHLDIPVLAFAVCMSVLVGLLAGIIPALRGSRTSLQRTMKETGQATLGGKQYVTSALVVAEFALAVVLVTGAGLLLRSFERLVTRDLGFQRNVATLEVGLTSAPYMGDSLLRLATWDRLIDAYRTLPGAEAVGVANWVPLGTAGSGFIDVDGRDGTNPGAGYRMVSEGYFDAIGLRLLTGRTFTKADGPSAERMVVINNAMAKYFWPNESAIGKRIRAKSMESGPKGEQAPWLTVIGVVSDLRQHGFEADFRMEMYTSFRQAPQWRTAVLTALVRTRVPPERLSAPMHAATAAIDPRITGDFSTLEAELSKTLAPRRITMSLLAGFAILALLLASLGIYAVVSYGVTRRSRELAMRVALGAQRSDLVRLVVFGGVLTASIGIAIGVVVALSMTRLMTAMLVDVTALDLATFLAAPAILLVAALAATVGPALRAMRADPVAAMRSA